MTQAGEKADGRDKSEARPTGRRHTFVMAPEPVQVIDEIGLPMKGAAVTVVLSDGREMAYTTDAEGKFLPRVGQNELFTVHVANCHECTPGDSTRTASGQHFAANGNGPR